MINSTTFIAIRRRRIKKMLHSGAVIVDIRETEDFAKSHIDGAYNIPKHLIKTSITNLKQLDAPLLVCGTLALNCIKTVNFLRSHGLIVYNGGNWNFVNRVRSSL